MTATPMLMTAPPLPGIFFANHLHETKTKQALKMFYRAACLIPSKITFILDIKRNDFTSWPGLKAELVYKYLPKNRGYCQITHQTKVKGNQLHAT